MISAPETIPNETLAEPENLAKLHLRIEGTESDEQEQILARFPVVIGRGPQADLQLRDRLVSRVHFEVVANVHHLMLFDRSSRNGTFVNGEQVTQAKLSTGDRILVGTTRVTVVGIDLSPPSPDGI